MDSTHDTLSVGFLTDRFDFLESGGLEEDLISFHVS